MTRIVDDVKLDFDSVLIAPKRSSLESRSDVELKRTFKFKHASVEWTGVPIVAANMDTIGTIEMALVLQSQYMLTTLHKFYAIDQLQDHLNAYPDWTIYSLGITENDLDKFALVVDGKDYPKFICIDVANGYTEKFLDFVTNMRAVVGNKSVIIAGNIVTPEMAEALVLAGADIVKVGIGPGSVCTTRIKTGVGYPQLSAVLECADAAHGLGGHVMSDGGCRTPGDVAKAFGAGADFVMLGGMLAGHHEAGEDNFVYDLENISISTTTRNMDFVVRKDIKGVRFYGMSSEAAMDKHYGGVADYRASEGKETVIPYKGYVKDTVQEILGGLRSTCTYVGAKTLKELPKRTTFIKVYNQYNQVYNQYEKE